jgi:hypothetical protein
MDNSSRHLVLVLIRGAGSIRQEEGEEKEGGLTCIQSDDGGFALGCKRVGGELLGGGA